MRYVLLVKHVTLTNHNGTRKWLLEHITLKLFFSMMMTIIDEYVCVARNKYSQRRLVALKHISLYSGN